MPEVTASPVVVECAGLPGAGKTTICGLVAVPYQGKGSVDFTDWRQWQAVTPAVWQVIRLCLSVRPLAARRILRGLSFVAFLRHYSRRNVRPMLLDQGLAQKLWSIVIDSRGYSHRRLERVIDAVRPLAPDHVVWVVTPLATIVRRIAGRRHGKSRFDGLPMERMSARLAAEEKLLGDIVRLMQERMGCNVVRLSGEDPAGENAQAIDALLR